RRPFRGAVLQAGLVARHLDEHHVHLPRVVRAAFAGAGTGRPAQRIRRQPGLGFRVAGERTRAPHRTRSQGALPLADHAGLVRVGPSCQALGDRCRQKGARRRAASARPVRRTGPGARTSRLLPHPLSPAGPAADLDSCSKQEQWRGARGLHRQHLRTDATTLDYLSDLRAREQVRVLDCNVPFNYSEINNAGVRASRGELLVFLNDDTGVLSDEWLEYMGGYAQLPHVGAVGAKLLYPGGKAVQHSGVLNLTNGPSHAFVHVDARAPGYFARNMLEHDWIAVTGACLMIERKKFDAVGGFDEDLAVTYNDTALCLSLAEHGLHQVVCPGVELIHHESLSRGKDALDRGRMARGERERVIVFGKHPGFYDRDPFHNPNLAPNDAYFGLRQ